jgi:hypothetical protein
MNVEFADLVPTENMTLRQRILVANGTVAFSILVGVKIVGDHQIYATLLFTFLQGVQKCGEIRAKFVVAIDNFEIYAGSIQQTLVDAFPMTTVFLMDNPDDVGIFGSVFIGNDAGVVFGTVIYHNDFHSVTAYD